ncbi:MAG: hypothetical protein LWX11_03260 [Firmicutes bacterium]|nr:hypothetical protein [Bacillota bacterium]
MKKVLLVVAIVLIAGGYGFWRLVRRGPVVAPPEETGAAFQVETYGGGFVYRYADGQTPLRALRWLPPSPSGHQVIQVVSQSDRQRVVIFKGETKIMDALVTRPSVIREGFFNFAELKEALLFPDAVVLLYAASNRISGQGMDEPSLVMALELDSGSLRWFHRAPGLHLAASPGPKEQAVFLYGPSQPIQRLPLERRPGEALGSAPARSTARTIEVPEEVRSLSILLPTGAFSFLAAHGAGLSSYSPTAGWKHWPLPEKDELTFSDAKPMLVSAKGYWWQPFPGKLLKVKNDGEPGEGNLLPEPPEPWVQDRPLLQLKGVDASGRWWFAPTMPQRPSPVATPEAPKSEAESAANGPDWNAYLAQGLDRLYRWTPDRRGMQLFQPTQVWTALPLPNGLNRSAAFPDFVPENGAILVESGAKAWRVDLDRVFP